MHALVLFPFTLLFNPIFRCVLDPVAVLHVVEPRPDVLVAIRQSHGALAVLEPAREIPLIDAPICVLKSTFAFKDVFSKLTLVGTLTFSKEVSSPAGKFTVVEFSIIIGAVLPLVAAMPDLLSLKELAFEADLSVVPGLHAVAMLLVVLPLPITCPALRVNNAAVSVGHVVDPVTLINVTIGLDHAPAALHFVIAELADVLGSVRELEDPKAVHNFFASDLAPLSLILLSILIANASFAL